jgi:Flp pilus assembly protein TadG
MMRIFLKARLRPDDERGAVLVIVALSLIAMFGMLVLVVDVGGLLWKRRELVNASDAAALSAAATCAVKATVDPRSAEAAADAEAAKNVSGANTFGTVTNATVAPGTCHGTNVLGWAKVTYAQPQRLFFAPVLGFSNSNQVTTRATAIWGVPGSANPMPITIYSSSFLSSCDIQTLPKDTECYFWFDNTGFGTSRFGLLDLEPAPTGGWDVPANQQQCPNQGKGSDLNGWILGSKLADDSVHYPNPTYVCVLSGQGSGPIWSALETREGDTLTFPINRCDSLLPGNPFGQVDNNGNEVSCSTAPHKYDIIGFVDFQLEQVLQSSAEWGGTPTTTCSKTNIGPVNTNDVVSLLSFNKAGCPSNLSAVIDQTTLLVNGKHPTDPNPGYTYDAVNHAIRWTGASNTKLDISFDWSVPGQCGTPPPNSSAVCIKVKTVEVRVGGGNPGNGSPFSNLRAVKLCDEKVPGSCDPVNVPNN